MKENEIKGYAISLVEFLVERLGRDISRIRNIILFGSASRGEAGKDSDIDIFVDVFKQSRELEKRIKSLKEDFLESKHYLGHWKLLGIENDFHIIVDKLDEYKLKDSVISQGLVLFGSFIDIPRDSKPMTIISWGNVKPENSRVNLHRKLFGYSFKGKRYPGLLERLGGQAISSGSIMVNREAEREFLDVFKSLGIPVKIRKVIELG